MRIFVVEPNGMGGMIHFAYQICTALSAHGATVCLITNNDYELGHLPHNFQVDPRLHLWPTVDPARAQAATNGRLASVPQRLYRFFRRGLRAAIFLREWSKLTLYIAHQRPDIVQFGVVRFPFQWAFLQAMRNADLTLVQICHEFESRHFRWRWTNSVQMQLYRAVYRNFSAIFFLSEDTRRRFLESFPFPEERAFAIPHGNQDIFRALAKGDLSIRNRYGLNAEDKVILFFGSLSRTKGLLDLLAAYAQLRNHCRGTKLLLVGYPGKYIDARELQSTARRLEIADSTVFDFRYVPAEEVGALIEAATVVVLPYRTATQSGALQVAYSFGRPVVATSVGGLSEVVEDGQSGYLVPPRSPADLAAAIERIIRDPILGEAMGRYARKLADTRFAWPPIAARILSVYRELLGREPDLRRDDTTVSRVDPDRQTQA